MIRCAEVGRIMAGQPDTEGGARWGNVGFTNTKHRGFWGGSKFGDRVRHTDDIEIQRGFIMIYPISSRWFDPKSVESPHKASIRIAWDHGSFHGSVVDFCLAKHQSLRNGQGDRILSPNFKGPTQRNADEECTCEEPSGLHSMCFNAFFHRKYLENYCDLFCMAAMVWV